MQPNEHSAKPRPSLWLCVPRFPVVCRTIRNRTSIGPSGPTASGFAPHSFLWFAHASQAAPRCYRRAATAGRFHGGCSLLITNPPFFDQCPRFFSPPRGLCDLPPSRAGNRNIRGYEFTAGGQRVRRGKFPRKIAVEGGLQPRENHSRSVRPRLSNCCFFFQCRQNYSFDAKIK